MAFFTNGTVLRMKIEATSSDVLIGSATNLNVLSGTPKLQIGSGTGHASLQFYSGATSVNGIYFGDTSSANVDRYDGYLEYRHDVGAGARELAMRVAGASHTTMHGTGNTTMHNGDLSFANGHGIDFSATPNSGTTGTTHTSSLLDDYEEGFWTPTFIGTSGTFTQGQQLGSYTKIGNLIHLTWYAGVTALGTATGNIQIGNLPYAALGGGTTNTRITTGSCMVDNLTLSSGKTWVHPYMSHGATAIQFYQSGTNTGWTTTPVDAVFTMIGGISYRTA